MEETRNRFPLFFLSYSFTACWRNEQKSRGLRDWWSNPILIVPKSLHLCSQFISWQSSLQWLDYLRLRPPVPNTICTWNCGCTESV